MFTLPALALHPVSQLARLIFGIIAFSRLRQPSATPQYRREFLSWIILVPVLSALGLFAWFDHPSIANLSSIASLSQALFNFGVVAVLLFRRHLHGPNWRTDS